MDEGRKRVLAIVAGILVARHLKTAEDLFGGPQRSLQKLRLIFSSHTKAREYAAPDWLDGDKIVFYQVARAERRVTRADLDALEKMLVEAGEWDVKKIRADGELGLFVRSLVGLDREAAKRAFDGFLAGKTFTANQIHFVNLVINDLTQNGWMSPARLQETPFIDFSPRGGVEGSVRRGAGGAAGGGAGKCSTERHSYWSALKELLVLDWRKRQSSSARVEDAIKDALDIGLPRAYSTDLREQTCSAVFEHFYESCPERDANIHI